MTIMKKTMTNFKKMQQMSLKDSVEFLDSKYPEKYLADEMDLMHSVNFFRENPINQFVMNQLTKRC